MFHAVFHHMYGDGTASEKIEDEKHSFKVRRERSRSNEKRNVNDD